MVCLVKDSELKVSVGDTAITFNVFSPHNSEAVNFLSDGPGERLILSTQHLCIMEFMITNCICQLAVSVLTVIHNMDVIVTDHSRLTP